MEIERKKTCKDDAGSSFNQVAEMLRQSTGWSFKRKKLENLRQITFMPWETSLRPRLLGVAILLLSCSAAASGQGIIIPRDCHDCIPRPPVRPHPIPRVLKVKSVNITVKIDAQVASTKVEQVFENDTPYRLEGSYFFPIPESAAISDFAIYDGEKRMAAEVIERQKARQIYNEIVRKMIDPGLLEYVGKDLFQANVFPIEPRSTRKIELSYTQVLKGEGGTIAYRYPLGSGRRIQSQPVGSVSGTVEIASPVDLKNIFSPSHKIAISRKGERRATLSFEGTGDEAQNDLNLYYSISDKDFGISMLTHREPSKDGYFLMLLSPKAQIEEQERVSKDIVFVLDTSGSMSGEKIEKAKRALKFGVESLSPRDRFNIISFSGEEHPMKSGLVEATGAARQEAIAFIDRLRAEGGTNINDSLVAALRLFEKSGRPAMVVFITDGLPTVGTTDIKEILRNVAEANRAAVRVFSFGVGYDVNTNLLDKLVADNRGAGDYIEPKEDLEVKVSNFFAKVNYPVISDLRLDFGGVEVDTMYPRVLPDLFKGSQITLVGRYKNSINEAAIRLAGKVGPRPETFSFGHQRFPAENIDNQFLPRLWATRRVGYLLEQIRLNGENKELKDEIIALGTRYGIVTPYTSFLVTDDMKDLAGRPRSEERQRRLDALAYPSGDMGSGRGSSANMPASGQIAVGRSQAEKSLRLSDVAEVPEQYSTRARSVGSKTFYLKDGVWVDAEHKETEKLQKVEVKFGSAEFFKLITDDPRLAEFFALGEKVTVVYGGKVYQVN